MGGLSLVPCIVPANGLAGIEVEKLAPPSLLKGVGGAVQLAIPSLGLGLRKASLWVSFREGVYILWVKTYNLCRVLKTIMIAVSTVTDDLV